MTLALVTGATGFIGAHLVRALLDEGVDVRALVRPQSDDRNLHGLDLARAEGDLRDAPSLARALEGVDVLFHVAALYRLTAADRADLNAINLEGTRSLMEAALRAGVERVVHTSSVAAVGHAHEDGAPADEADWADAADFAGPYEASKYHSERLVRALVVQEGLPATVVNPTTPIGPLDLKPTPTGRLIIDAASGAMPGYLRSAGLNIVHVRDVARGHVLAWQRGEPGQRYILGNREGNLTLRQVIERAQAAADRDPSWPPLLPIPYPLAWAYARLDEGWLARRRGRPVRAPLAGVRLARHRLWYDCRKAVDELGLPQTPLDEAFADAVDYFRSTTALASER